MIILFIDDQEERHELAERYLAKHHTLLHAFNYDDSVEILSTNTPNNIGLVMFDRDLGDFVEADGKQVERTGHTIIRYMRDNIPQEKWPPTAIVHSYNNQAQYMAEDLRAMGIITRQIQFSGDLLKQLVLELAMQ